MVTPTSNPLGYLGIDSNNPRDTFYRRRAPTINDIQSYKIGDRWIDNTSNTAYIFTGITSGQAIWLSITGNATGYKYLVGPVGSGAPYSSIQAAINAALADGASITDQKNVFVLPGIYVENIFLAGYVHVIGFGSDGRVQGNILQGSATANSGGTTLITNMAINPTVGNSIDMVGPATNTVAVLNCSLNAPNNCIDDSSAAPQIILAWESVFVAGNFAVNILNAGSFIAWDCLQITGGAGSFNLQQAFSIIFQSIINSASFIDNSNFIVLRSSINAPIALTNGSNTNIKFCVITTATESYTIDATSIAQSVLNEISCNAGSGFYAVGAGTLRTGGNVYTGSATAPSVGTVFTFISD